MIARPCWRRRALALVTIAGLIVVLASGGNAASPTFDDPVAYCAAVGTIDRPDGRYAGPPVPDWMARALIRATGAPPTAPLEAFRHAAWRCVGGTVMACSYGANIPCDEKADGSRRASDAVREFCRAHHEAAVVPAVATGRATIYEWRCGDGRPRIVRQTQEIDAQGFASGFWYPVAPPRADAP